MRRIFTIIAFIVDANGTYNILDGYPKKFDSKNYGDDEHKAYLRAMSDLHETFGDMCKVDTRKVQTVVMLDESGSVVECFTIGSLDEPKPEE